MKTGDPDMPDLSLCSFEYLAAEMRKRGATVTPAPHGGDFESPMQHIADDIRDGVFPRKSPR
jgi:hypothetical protein